MRYRRADLLWAPLLVLSAGLSPLTALAFDRADWLAIPLAVLAYAAGRSVASVSLPLWVFTGVTLTDLALAFWRSPDPLSNWLSGPLSIWLSAVLIEFVNSVLPWWIGRYRRLRAEQRGHEHDIVAERARLHERTRIARDMHDTLGHELALIALHGGALELAKDLTEAQRRTAAQLRAGASRATDRLHEIVEVLGSADAAADRRPADETIDELVRRAGEAGLPVRLRYAGPVPAWSPIVRQAARRVVQESLTNATRHAPGARVTVTVARQDAETRLEIANDPPARPSGGTGTRRGLVGLDERVRLVGGRLTAGARSDGGWTVTAMLPDGPAPRREDGALGDELGVNDRRTRRRLLQTAALPLGIGLTLIAAAVAVEAVTMARTGLTQAGYDQLRPGQHRVDIARLLPPHQLDRPPTTIAAPPPSSGVTCVYYHAGDDLLDVDGDTYRLCYQRDVLVSKDRLLR